MGDYSINVNQGERIWKDSLLSTVLPTQSIRDKVIEVAYTIFKVSLVGIAISATIVIIHYGFTATMSRIQSIFNRNTVKKDAQRFTYERAEKEHQLKDLESKYSFKLQDLLYKDKPEEWQELLHDPTKKQSFIEFIRNVIGLYDSSCQNQHGYLDFAIAGCHFDDILKAIRDIVKKEGYRDFMLEVFPTYPLLVGASELNIQQENLRRGKTFFAFTKHSLLIENGKSNQRQNKDWVSDKNWDRLLEEYKSIESEGLKGLFDLFYDGYLDESSRELIVKRFVKEIFDKEIKKDEWEDGAKRGVLAPFCFLLINYLANKKNGMKVGDYDAKTIFKRLNALVGLGKIRLMKAAIPLPPLVFDSKGMCHEELTEIFMTLNPLEWTWAVELFKRYFTGETVSFFDLDKGKMEYIEKHQQQILDFLERKDSTTYQEILKAFIAERKKKSPIKSERLCGLLLRHVLKQMDKEGKIGDITAKELLGWIQESTKSEDGLNAKALYGNQLSEAQKLFYKVMKETFPAYPLTFLFEGDDERNTHLFELVKYLDSNGISQYSGSSGNFEEMQKKFLHLDPKQMEGCLNTLKAKDPTLLKALLFGTDRHWNSEYQSIIWRAIKQLEKGDKINFIALLQALKKGLPSDEWKNVITNRIRCESKNNMTPLLYLLDGSKDENLVKAIKETYYDEIPEVVFLKELELEKQEELKKIDEDGKISQPGGDGSIPSLTLSKQEMFLALSGGKKELSEKERLSIASEVLIRDPSTFLEKNTEWQLKWLMALWNNEERQLAMKILSQPFSYYHHAYYNGIRTLSFHFQVEAGWTELLESIQKDDPEFFGKCFSYKGKDALFFNEASREAIQKISAYRAKKEKKEELECFNDIFHTILMAGTGENDVDIVGQTVFKKKPSQLNQFFVYSKGDRLCLDRMENEDLIDALTTNNGCDQVKEISLVGCADLSYIALSLIYERFPKVEKFIIQRADLASKDVIHTLKHLFLDLEATIPSITIEFADVIPVEFNLTEKGPWLQKKYHPLFKRFGLSMMIDNENLDVDGKGANQWAKCAFEGRVIVNKQNRKHVEKWLFSLQHKPLCSGESYEEINKELRQCFVLLRTCEGFLKDMLGEDEDSIEETDFLSWFGFDKEDDLSLIKAFVAFLLENQATPTESNVNELKEKVHGLNWFKKEKLFLKRVYEEGLSLS